ncbi:MAG: hypothetical protein ACTSWX_12015 [Promethearchaeota archaeon]
MSKTNKFTAQINEKRNEFQVLLEKFNNLDDPIERYMKRQEMHEIKEFLTKHHADSNLKIP